MRCLGVPCGPAPHVNHASVNATGHAYRDTAAYTCNAGYFLNSSSSVMTCLANGTWSVELVTCAPLMCDSSMLPTFSEIIVETTRASSTVRATFPAVATLPPNRLGNDISGEDNTIGSNTFGHPIQPNIIIPTEFAAAESPDIVYQQDDEVNIKCVDGYTLFTTPVLEAVMSTNLKCSEGNWTPVFDRDIICLPDYCTQLPSLHNSVVDLRNEPIVEAKYVCLSGYGFELPDQSLELVSEQVTEFSIYCYSNIGWDIPPQGIAECVSEGCGPINLPVDSVLQVKLLITN